MSNFRVVVPTDAEIDAVISEVYDSLADNTKFPNASYEDGVLAAIEWLIGDTDFNPLSEDE